MPGKIEVLTFTGDLKKSYDCDQEAIEYASTVHVPEPSSEVFADYTRARTFIRSFRGRATVRDGDSSCSSTEEAGPVDGEASTSDGDFQITCSYHALGLPSPG
jgi:hypothetical protein